MNPAELRIGNYVYYADVMCKVEGYTSDGYLYTDGVTAPILSFQPVELTEQWMSKLGFTHEVIAYYYFEKIYKKGSFTLSESFVLLDIDLNINVDYVHQLQNLYFALIGEELMLQIPE